LNHLGRAHPINLPMGAHRAERIAGLLAARDDWTVAATRAMQLDVASPHAARFMEVLRPLLPDTRAGRILRDWDLGYDLASEGASLFERFYRALVVEVFGAVCGPDVVRFLVEETPILADFYANFDGVLLRPASVWYGEAGRDAVWRRVAARSVAEPVRPWGEQQRLVMRHLLLGGRLPAWLGFDRGPIALAGGRGTIRQGQVYRSGGRETSFAPSYRLVTDLGEAAAHTSLAGGPSDRRFSRWYASEVASWLAGRAKRLAPRAESLPPPAVERPWHTRTVDEVLHDLHTRVEVGLEPEDIARRRGVHGPNVIEAGRRRGPLRMLLDQLSDFMVLVLLASAVVAGFIGEPQDTVAIAVIVVLNATLGFVQEYRAERAVAALKALAAPQARVRRGGELVVIPAGDLVPGDVVLL
jgi:hypothetical protein